MGFLSFMKKVFAVESEDDAELNAARARHGISIDESDAVKPKTEKERFAEEYDVWEDIKNIRSTFFIGNWASKKFRIVGEDKVKKQLEELEKKREEEERKSKGEGES
jgi:hypothetical protein